MNARTYRGVLVVDFGAQYAQLIARRVREAGVYSEIVPPTITPAEVFDRKAAGIILSGGPASVNVSDAPRIDPALYELSVPVLGICYGAQLMADQLGGAVGRHAAGEYGRTDLTVLAGGGTLLGGLPAEHPVWMSHFDAVVAAPPGAVVTAATADSPAAAFELADRSLYAVQFHPEVAHSPHGQRVIERFLAACGNHHPWTTGSIINSAVEEVQALVGEGRAICGLSGGVDSAVAAALVHRAIGDRLICVFVDTGLMRQGEAAQVSETFRRHLGIELVEVDAADRFLAALVGITDPEAKRRAIGEVFIRTFEQARDQAAAAGRADPARFLVQGTLYPDVIESGTAHAAVIKSHHNVGGLPGDMDFELVEPLRLLFKDEVRAVGADLGLPDEIVWRQPFPGPGLGVRIIGEVTRDKLETLRRADAIVAEELRAAELEQKLDQEIWQSFAVLPDIRSVGVMGDERTYGRPVVVRAVTSADAMTADWARLPHDVLEAISGRLINEVPGVNRVVYDITSKPPGTIEWE